MKFTISSPNNSNIIIEVEKSEKIVFLGANGTGKSKLGQFIEKSVFSQTQSGFEQNQILLTQKKQELSITEGKIERLTQEIDNFDKLIDDEIVSLGIDYQDRKVILPNKEVFTRKEILSFFLNGKIQAENVIFSNNSLVSGSFPIQSIDQIEGGTIEFSGLVFEVDLMKITNENKKSIETARKYFQTKNQVILQSELSNSNKTKKELLELENKIKEYDVLGFKFCQRISAHRSLVINPNISPKDNETAIKELLFGQSNQTQNTDSKWRNSVLQSDYDKLLIALISEEAEVGAKFKQNKIQKESIKTNLDYIIEIWNKLLPHRKIKIDGLKISVTNNSSSYQLSELSDGEKTIFYLLGQCLSAPKQSLIIVDEPDIHIHKAILSLLFNYIEILKNDCSFIYITHDLEFAETRIGKKYALLNYQNSNKWEIEELINDEEIPENIIASISGIRNPILFVEGKKDSSLDNIYNSIYSKYTVIQVESCNEVRNYTKSLNKNKKFHKVNCFGLIDKDGLDDSNINKLKKDNIFVLPVALVENLFFLPKVAKEIFNIVGESEKFNRDEFILKAIGWIQADENWKSKWIKEKISYDIQSKINQLPNRVDGLKESIFQYDLGSKTNEYANELEIANDIKNNEDKLLKMLKLCRGKHLLPKFATELGLKDKTSLENKILNNLNSQLVNKLRDVLPKIE